MFVAAKVFSYVDNELKCKLNIQIAFSMSDLGFEFSVFSIYFYNLHYLPTPEASAMENGREMLSGKIIIAKRFMQSYAILFYSGCETEKSVILKFVQNF